jgi:hypothetical protein
MPQHFPMKPIDAARCRRQNPVKLNMDSSLVTRHPVVPTADDQSVDYFSQS